MNGGSVYRVGWADPAYMVWRLLRLSVTGAAPLRRRTVWGFARSDLGRYVRRTLSALSRDGLVPPWQAEWTGVGCSCNAARGWTRGQALRRVETAHRERVRLGRCEGGAELRMLP